MKSLKLNKDEQEVVKQILIEQVLPELLKLLAQYKSKKRGK